MLKFVKDAREFRFFVEKGKGQMVFINIFREREDCMRIMSFWWSEETASSARTICSNFLKTELISGTAARRFCKSNILLKLSLLRSLFALDEEDEPKLSLFRYCLTYWEELEDWGSSWKFTLLMDATVATGKARWAGISCWLLTYCLATGWRLVRLRWTVLL